MLYSLIAAACLALAPAPSQAPPNNLARDAGFELVDAGGHAADWSGWNDVWQVDRAVARTGSCSARFTNGDASRYVLLSQRVAVRPGKRYRFSCAAKTRDVVGEDSGATICMEWSDKAGKYLGGSYPNGIKGTTDWTEVSGETSRIPRNADAVTVSVYVRQRMTGTAWFDDVSVREEVDPPFEGAVVVPGYRGVLAGARTAPVRIRGWLGATDATPLSRQRVVAEIVRLGDSRPLVRRVVSAPTHPEIDIALPTNDLPTGRYTARVRVEAVGSAKPRWTSSAALTRSVKAPAARVGFLADGTTLVYGKPFFPIGLYEGATPAQGGSQDRLREIAAGGFNCVMNYDINASGPTASAGYLDAAQRSGLKVIYSIKDLYETPQSPNVRVGDWRTEKAAITGLVTRFRSHPALLGWYLNDEMPLSMHAKLREHYEWVRKLDRDHPAWVVLYQVPELPGYVDTTDVMGADPYPVPSQPITMVSEWTDAAVRTGQPAWMVPQVFDWSVYNKENRPAPPTLDEMRCMTWQALAHGANGLVYYSFFDLKRAPDYDRHWQDVKQIAAEVKAMTPWLVADPRRPVGGSQGVQWRAWKRGGEWLQAVINTNRTAATATVKLPIPRARISALAGSPAPDMRGGVLHAELGPLEVRLYRISSGARR